MWYRFECNEACSRSEFGVIESTTKRSNVHALVFAADPKSPLQSPYPLRFNFFLDACSSPCLTLTSVLPGVSYSMHLRITNCRLPFGCGCVSPSLIRSSPSSLCSSLRHLSISLFARGRPLAPFHSLPFFLLLLASPFCLVSSRLISSLPFLLPSCHLGARLDRIPSPRRH